MYSVYLFVLLALLGLTGALLGATALIRFYASQHDGPDTEIPSSTFALVFLQLAMKIIVAIVFGLLLEALLPLPVVPLFTALLNNTFYWSDLWPTLRPAIVFGIHGGLVMSIVYGFLYPKLLPKTLSNFILQSRQCQGFFTRLLFEGVVTEIMIRWGLTLSFLALGFVISGTLSLPLKIGAITIASLLHAASILPSLYASYRAVMPWQLGVIFITHTSMGMLFGWVFVQHGLLAAMLCHMVFEATCFTIDRVRLPSE